MHYQCAPFAESKVVHCIRGAVWDVIVDVRRSSATYGQWRSFQLSESGHSQLYVGPGLAHGYLTLSEDAELHYLLSAPYAPDSAAGILWNDPRVAIEWPMREVIVSSRDAALPVLADARDPFAST
jgi:dTDP-4-dehydrorhamnose 3,5-epimerase